MHPVLQKVAVAGERVRLRPHRPEDADAAFALLHRREPVLRWLVWAGPGSREELASCYASWRVGDERADDYHLAVERVADGALVGSLGLRFVGHPESGDLGYWIGEPHQGRGYGSEAVALACHLAFRHLRARALEAWVFVGNAPSRRVLEKSGFTLARTTHRRVGGRRQEEWALVLLASEWRAAGHPPPREDGVELAWASPGAEGREG